MPRVARPTAPAGSGAAPGAGDGAVVVVEAYHTPVMVAQVVAALQVRPHGRYLDATVGEGGHALAILEATTPPPRLLGIDRDPQALERARRRLARFQDRVMLVQGSYSRMRELAEERGFAPVHGILFDLGVSSLQLEEARRGFSVYREAPLDMRFDPAQRLTAHHVVNRYPEERLAHIIARFGQEPRARRIARAIVRARPIETTVQLAQVVARAVGRPRGRIHPATRTFQAIRMEVNRELEELEKGLEQAVETLAPGGRLAVISYHSLEDRLVKEFLRREATDCLCPPEVPHCACGHRARLRLVRRRVTKPSPQEVAANPRGRSARLRVAERVEASS